ncbi:MAG: hypothetical protein ROZ37_11445 [Aromatoleum sp.]|uniref:hypothetical protein n=1 Tax=Aromatoleum sp. TaxID=2307007 RepID=UPI002893A7B8|nr:hypothetical protein [Aromatoleum sp.]MDT3670930.1 hypothetical protein [Aromatoleum sp.]
MRTGKEDGQRGDRETDSARAGGDEDALGHGHIPVISDVADYPEGDYLMPGLDGNMVIYDNIAACTPARLHACRPSRRRITIGSASQMAAGDTTACSTPRSD